MKILIISNLFPNPLEQTRSVFNEQQFLALAKSHEVKVVSPIDMPRWMKWTLSGEFKKLKIKDWKGIPVLYPRQIQIPRVLLQFNGWLTYFRLLTLAGAIKKENPDIIFAAWAYPDGFGVAKLAKSLGLPFVLKVHGSDIDRLGKFPKLVENTALACNEAQKVFAVSEHLKRAVCDLGVSEGQVSVVKNGIDKEVFNETVDYMLPDNVPSIESKKYFLFVGNLLLDKGVLDLVKAYHQTGIQDFKLIYVGSGSTEDQLRSYIEQNQLQEQVILVGRKPKEQVAAYMRHAACVVLPSYHEGLPNVLNESISLGTPVIGTRVGGIPEVIQSKESGVLVSVGDVDQLADALITVSEGNHSRESVAASLQLRSWEGNAEVITRELEAIVEHWHYSKR